VPVIKKAVFLLQQCSATRKDFSMKKMFPSAQLLVAILPYLLLLLRSGLANFDSATNINYRYFQPERSAPRFVNQGGQTIKVKVGDTVTIPCKIQNKGDATVVWKQGNRVIYADRVHIGKDLRASIVDNTSLVLTGVDTQYTGNYTCEVEWSPEKPPVSLSHYLEVCVPPSVHAVNTEGGSFVDVKEGDNATLECEADGIPRPTIHWISNRWGSNRQEYGSKLYLTKSKRTDSGQYTCIATNQIGNPESAQVTLRVQYAPVVTAVPARVSCLEGYRVALTCSVLSVPKSDVQWYFNMRPLKMDSKYTMEERGNNYTLTISEVRQTDLGDYTCTAVNKISEQQAQVVLTGTPFDLDISSSSQGIYKHTYNLTWTVKTYVSLDKTEISWRKTGYGPWKTQSIDHRTPWAHEQYYNSDTQLSGYDHTGINGGFHSASSNSRSISEGTYSFIHLKPDTEYEVKIRAKNYYGWSKDEPAVVFKTSNKDPEPQRMSTYHSDGSSVWRSHAISRYLCLSFLLTTFVTMLVVV